MKNEMNDKPVEVSERAQIVVQPRFGQSLVLRYRKAAVAEKDYKLLVKAWSDKILFHVSSDMFVSTIDLSEVVFISLVDHAKRAKFIPIQ